MKKLAKALVGVFAAVAMLFTGVLVTSGAAYAAGDEPTCTNGAITVTDGAKNDQNVAYSAYKLFNATDLGADKYSYTVNDTFKEAVKAGLSAAGMSVTDSTDLVAEVGKLNATTTPKFAAAAYKQIAEKQITATATGAASGDNYVINTSETGYYLVAQTSEPADEAAASAIIVTTANAGACNTVNSKKDVPTHTKKIQEKNDSESISKTNPTGWQDGADYDLGDNVPFQLTGKLPPRRDGVQCVRLVQAGVPRQDECHAAEVQQ